METNTKPYDIAKGSERIDEILSSDNKSYEHIEGIPDRNQLSYSNGYYVNVGALFIDIRRSSELTEEHKKSTLGKLYRSFISECVAVMNSSENCKEINIHGDCVWGVFDINSSKQKVQQMFYIAAQLYSIVVLLNKKFEKKNIQRISVGIGLDIGEALMIQAGFKGSGLNDVVWMGDVVNSACHLASTANKNGIKSILMTPKVYQNLDNDQQRLLDQVIINGEIFYHKNLINKKFDEWIEANV